MNHTRFSRHTRRRLLSGISTALLATLLPATGHAQTRQIDATGRIAVTTTQQSQGAGTAASIIAPPATIQVSRVDNTMIAASGNALDTAAAANAATVQLEHDMPDNPGGSTTATVNPGLTDVRGSMLIVSRQSMQRAPVSADAAHAGVSVNVGPVDSSRVSTDSNTVSATARGNDHVGTLANDRTDGGIVLSQFSDASPVRATQDGMMSLLAASSSDGALSLSGNNQAATAVTNAGDASLSSTGPFVSAGDGNPTTLVDVTGAAAVRAGNVVVQDQRNSSLTSAVAGTSNGASGDLLNVGNTERSSVIADDNGVAAAATGNRITTTLDMNAPAMTGTGSAAAALSHQQLDASVLGTTDGGTAIHVTGAARGSDVSASNNSVDAAASGNVAGTAMTIRSASISRLPELPSDPGDPGSGPGGGPGTGPVGTAIVDRDGSRSTTAPIAAHNDQRVGVVAITAAANGGTAAIGVDGPVLSTTVAATDNLQSAQARANDGTTGITIAAPAFASSADLLSVQSSDADVTATAGNLDHRAGVTLSPMDAVDQSKLSVSGNGVQTLAIGNRATNTLSLDAASAADGGDHHRSKAGTVGTGYGAGATLALTSAQKVGIEGALPSFSSSATGRFSVTGNGDVTSSSISIDGNQQAAGAVANTADNRLILSSPVIGDAGTALTSSQFGAATVRANSAAKFNAPGSATQSDVNITGNANQAMAAINEATNHLVVDDMSAGGVQMTFARTDGLGAASIRGGQVLNNTQFAMGSVAATATMMLAGSTSTGFGQSGLAETRFAIEGNSALADATGNRASNAVDLGVGSSGGIASSQMSTAGVTAMSQMVAGLGTPRPDQSIEGSTVTIDDNSNSAVARGNYVDSKLTLAPQTGFTSSLVLNGTSRAAAPAVLNAGQSNYGPVSAIAITAASVPLNASDVTVVDSRASLSGNSTTASAYANGALNTVTLAPDSSGVALISSQTNYAPVTARVMSSTIGFAMGDLRQSNVSLSNNSVIASATGNVATNLVTTLH